MAKCTTKEFMPLTIAVMTVSDRHTLESDTSGHYLADALTAAGHLLADHMIINDNRYQIRAQVSQWIADDSIHAVIINGGTGFTQHDSTPIAVAPLFDRNMEGFGELFRHLSFEDIGTSSVQSRAIAGLANQTAIFCIPGSPGACKLGWEKIISEQLDARHRPCNFVGHLTQRTENHK
ncbi:molybdenum cofactor biosynthesis protein B [Parashewanella spongiae]|uniref:Molybdenum cofactor biosynthesis protein B n=1 Tax=Parashewanella spongiae TaxID=342950 RepID=A0A3A6TVE7_9GAMM|nr:molybdenum cofactor biosynthesis protein B [Parashewanella spongiae]MCL1078063.1 molybdenum cofactor biosynthesis protein B [Parashewanella spongiae]RJY16937.1 molybdenum cofactor biosynthesis protein B [Parashewanella spongiae]